jgi:hypothetical protein
MTATIAKRVYDVNPSSLLPLSWVLLYFEEWWNLSIVGESTGWEAWILFGSRQSKRKASILVHEGRYLQRQEKGGKDFVEAHNTLEAKMAQ